MATPKKKPAAKAAPRKKAAPKIDPEVEINKVVVLTTSIGHDLVIRSNPTDQDVRNFVGEHTRRYIEGAAGGPSGIPAYRIFSAKRYTDEPSFLKGEDNLDEVNIADLLPA
jgi:hypothetical protein